MKPSELLNELDRLTLHQLAQRHPHTAIRVLRGFFDGTEGRPFGYVPNDWDGASVVTYDFRLVPAYLR